MKRNRELKIWAVVLWLVIWEVFALILNQEIFLVSPVKALMRFFQLAVTGEFWFSAAASAGRILLGFLIAAVLGVFLGAVASKHRRIRELLAPINITIKSVPVASFVILAIICFSSKYLSILISALIVFPIIYTSTLSGAENVEGKLLEMGKVFGLGAGKVRRYIYAPGVYNYLRPACQTAIGMAWKAGIAAEVIGIPKGSIGTKIQQAKVYLETPDLIAWTIGVVLLSLASEKLIVFLMDRIMGWIKTAPKGAQGGRTEAGESGTAGKGQNAAGPFIPGQNASGAFVPWDGGIQVSHLTKSFGEEKVLSDLSFKVEGGESAVIMAPSGEGKTTLLRIIGGLEKSDSGEVLSSEKMSVEARNSGPKGKIAFLFQEDRLLEYMDGAGNIRLACGVSEHKMDEAAKALSLQMEDFHGKPVAEYSGGMKRRVALIRTMLSDGTPILLDEPFKGLDEETRRKAAAFVLKERRGRTLLMVTHDPDEIELIQAKKVIRLGEQR